MSSGHIKFSQFQYIVKLCQILRQWRGKAHRSIRRTPPDVPSGHLAVCVDINHTRFVVRASYLNHPVFKKLLVEAEEEYGFSNHGPLTIPCEEVLFQEAIRFISRSDSGIESHRCSIVIECKAMLTTEEIAKWWRIQLSRLELLN